LRSIARRENGSRARRFGVTAARLVGPGTDSRGQHRKGGERPPNNQINVALEGVADRITAFLFLSSFELGTGVPNEPPAAA